MGNSNRGHFTGDMTLEPDLEPTWPLQTRSLGRRGQGRAGEGRAGQGRAGTGEG